MGKKIIILGGRGIGMIASSIIDAHIDYELLGFLNDVVPVGQKVGKYKKNEVIGTSKDIKQYVDDENIYFFIAYLGMLDKLPVFEKIKELGIQKERFINLIHPTAFIPEDYCSIGQGVLFAPLSHLSPDTKIGDNCFLLPNSFVGHDSTLDEFVSVANNATVGGNVHVERGVHIGSNSTIREDVTIGEFSIVGMGSVVLKDVPPNTVVAGNPAKIIKKISKK